MFLSIRIRTSVLPYLPAAPKCQLKSLTRVTPGQTRQPTTFRLGDWRSCLSKTSRRWRIKSRRKCVLPGRRDSDENIHSPRLEGRCEEIGRASLLAGHHPGHPLPMRLGGSLALPTLAGFEFFHSFRGAGGGLNPNQKDPLRKADAFCPSQEGIFREETSWKKLG